MVLKIPDEASADIGPLIAGLKALGFEPFAALYGRHSFGNYYLDWRGPCSFRLTRERLQYMVFEVDVGELKKAGLFRAFNDRDEFTTAILAWAKAISAMRTLPLAHDLKPPKAKKKGVKNAKRQK